jgi:flagellar motor switch protein FliM
MAMAAGEAGAPSGEKVDGRVLRGRVERARSLQGAVAGGVMEQAWDMALRRAAQDMISLRVDITQRSLRQMSLTEFLDMPGARSLIGILDGPAEATGVIILSPEVLSGLIEVQTIGTVSNHPPMARKPTRTDAAMVAGFLDSALAELDMALLGQAEAVWAAGFRYASFLDDARPLALILEDTAWQVAEVEISLAGGAKVGRIILALPAKGRGNKGADEIAAQANKATQFNADLREQIGHATASLDAILVRLQVDLSELLKLGAEDVLPLFATRLDTVQLETMDGRRVATARLGQAQGMRALCITRVEGDTADDAPIDPLHASAQSQFTPRGEALPPPEQRNFVPEVSADPASMSDLMSGLMSEIGEPFLPSPEQGFDEEMLAGL